MGRRGDHCDHPDGRDARVVRHSGWRRTGRLCGVPGALCGRPCPQAVSRCSLQPGSAHPRFASTRPQGGRHLCPTGRRRPTGGPTRLGLSRRQAGGSGSPTLRLRLANGTPGPSLRTLRSPSRPGTADGAASAARPRTSTTTTSSRGARAEPIPWRTSSCSAARATGARAPTTSQSASSFPVTASESRVWRYYRERNKAHRAMAAGRPIRIGP
jgi:hypothetical protein